MDYFCRVADIMHTLGLMSLIFSIRKRQNWVGVSYRTMEILLGWFLFRYIDLFVVFISYYLTFIKNLGKDGAVVPGQMELNGTFDPRKVLLSQQVPCGLACGKTSSLHGYLEWKWFLNRIRPAEFSDPNTF